MEYKWNIIISVFFSLNPCFNGIQMELAFSPKKAVKIIVLILVLMEYKWNTPVDVYFRTVGLS